MAESSDSLARIAELEAQNRDLEVALEQARGEVHQLINLAGHDLQAPLRTVRMFLDLLLTTQGVGLSPKARQYIGHCLTAASHGETLVQGLLAFSRVETSGGPLVEASLAELARSALTQVRMDVDAAGGTVDIGALPARKVDVGQVVEVFRILFDNAVRYRSSEPPRIVVRAQHREDGWLVVEVEDNAVGIPPAGQAAALEPFRRVHTGADIDGTGLGLAIAGRILARHGGELGLRSEAGVGSTFWFALPPAQTPGQP